MAMGVNEVSVALGIHPVVLLIVLVWTLIWKGIGLWKSGRNNQLYWFVALFVLNTLGVLPIVYLLWFQKKGKSEKKVRKKISKKKK